MDMWEINQFITQPVTNLQIHEKNNGKIMHMHPSP